MRFFTLLFATFFFFLACETELKEGHYTCDPNEPGACPDGWVCQLRGTDGVHRCYESSSAFCQDGVRDPGEICDGADLGDFTCETGWPICLTNCTAICTVCGNGRIELNERGVGEECDDGNTEDGDGCSAQCEIERSYCVTPETDECLNWCGDGTINGPELCEPGNLGGYDCTDFGFHDGALGCSADCRTFDLSACAHYCGDGQIQDVEACDGIDQKRRTCWDYYFTGGDLDCDTGCTRDFSGCFNSWNRQTVNTVGTITSIHGTDDSNLFAVSMSGWVGQLDGEHWTNHQLTGDPMLRGVFTLAPDDVWAVGTFGALWHFDGSDWTLFTEAASLHLTGIWGTSPTNLYACGFWPGDFLNGYNSEGVILHWDGTVWTEVVWQAENTSTTFLAIHGSGPQDVWVTGSLGQVWHFDGTSWEKLALPPAYVDWEFWSVHVPRPGQVAFSGSKETYEGFVLEYENGSFREVTVDPDHVIRQIRGTSLADLWMLQDDGVVLRREVGGWRFLSQAMGSRFWSMWNDHPDSLWIGGANGLLFYYSGEFETTSYAFPQMINRIWGPASGDFYLAGATGALHHLENDSWVVESPPPGMIINDLWGPDARTIMAVGRNGLTALRNDGTWTGISTGVSTHLMGVHGCGTDFWAVGTSGTVLRYAGSGWLRQTVSSNAQLNDVHCVSPTAVFVVGNVGTILFFDGNTWQALESGTTKNLNAVWGTSRNHVYAVGNDGLILFFDGTTWQPVDSGVGVKLTDITGSDARNIWVSGSSGVLLRHAGVRFSPVVVPGNPNLRRLHLQPNGRLLAANDTTRFMEYRTSLLPQPFVTMDCPATVPLYCQEKRIFDTTGLPARKSTWGPATGLSGPEMAFEFSAPLTGTVTWTLSPELGDARLIVLGPEAYATCDTGSVLAVSTSNPDGAQSVSMSIVRNDVYYIIIDSPAAATGSVTSTCTR